MLKKQGKSFVVGVSAELTLQLPLPFACQMHTMFRNAHTSGATQVNRANEHIAQLNERFSNVRSTKVI